MLDDTRRKASLIAVAAAGALACSLVFQDQSPATHLPGGTPTPEPRPTTSADSAPGSCRDVRSQSLPARIFAAADWYRSRPEPQHARQGVLLRRDAPTGPGTRAGLLFTLMTDDEALPVYAAGVADRLAPFAGCRVTVEGKLVDPGSPDADAELWIGTILTAEVPARS